MAMDRQHGWIDYFCSKCGELAGHYRREKPENPLCFKCDKKILRGANIGTGIVKPGGIDWIDKSSFAYRGEVRNEFPRITIKSLIGVPMQIAADAEGVEGLGPVGGAGVPQSWIIVGDITIDVSIPKLSWKDRLRILFSGFV